MHCYLSRPNQWVGWWKVRFKSNPTVVEVDLGFLSIGHTLNIPLQMILIQEQKNIEVLNLASWRKETHKYYHVNYFVYSCFKFVSGGGCWFCVNRLYRWSLSFSPRIINSKSQVAHKISVIKKQIIYLQVCLSRYRQEILAWNIISIFWKLPIEQKKK